LIYAHAIMEGIWEFLQNEELMDTKNSKVIAAIVVEIVYIIDVIIKNDPLFLLMILIIVFVKDAEINN